MRHRFTEMPLPVKCKNEYYSDFITVYSAYGKVTNKKNASTGVNNL
jgi:hypothetical protein